MGNCDQDALVELVSDGRLDSDVFVSYDQHSKMGSLLSISVKIHLFAKL